MRTNTRNFRLALTWLTLVALALSFALVPAALVGASPGWYDSDWGQRRPVSIDNTGNANTLTDYQVKTDVAYDSDMQPDFDGLRFTDSDGTSELSYWIEEKTDSVSATAWVKVPSIPGSSTKTVYMYYGNPAASSASNGDNTFLFFDDFSGATLDTGKWDDLCDGSGTATIVGGKLRLDSPSGAYNHGRVRTKMSFGDVAVQHKWWLVTWPVCPTIVDNNHADTYFGVYGGDWMYIQRYRNHYCGSAPNAHAIVRSIVLMGGVFVENVREDCTLMEGTFKLDRYGTTVHTYYDDTLQLSYDSAFTDSSQLWFDAHGSFAMPPTTADYDDVFVRNYTSPEPTTSVGGEELIEVDIDIDIKPGSDPNSINTKSKGVIPVAILGSDTFNVTDVDVTTLWFEGAQPAHDLSDPEVYADHLQDVNLDGFMDLVSHYRTQHTGIAPGDTEACLEGQTTGGVPIEGCDSVRVRK